MPRAKFPRLVDPYDAGPFMGVRDTLTKDPTAYEPAFLAEAENLYCQEPERGGALLQRPGFYLLNGAALGTGGAGGRTPQCVFQFTELDGDEHSVLFVGGKMYELVWPATFNDITPVAGVNAPVGFTIAATSHIYCVHFADYLIVTDGVNRPWKYTFATNTASYLTDLTYACFGPPTVYAGKLFFVKNSERNKLIYSNELDPDTGYDAGANTRFWKMGQTDQEAITCLHGTNENLYWFREESIGSIYGEVTDDFQTDSTHDGVSQHQGTISPKTVFGLGRFVWFINQLGRPCIIMPGGGVREIWHDCAETVRSSERGRLAEAWTHFNPDTGLVGIAHGLNDTTSDARPKAMLMFATENDGAMKLYQGQWKHRLADDRRFGAGAVLKEQFKRQVFVHLDAAGFAWMQRLTWDNSAHWDTLASGGASPTAIRCKAVTGHMGYDEDLEHTFDRLTIALRGETDGATLQLRSRTSQRNWTATPNLTASSVPETELPARAELGQDDQGRWIQHELIHEAIGLTEFALLTIRQEATAIGPGVTAA